MSFSVKDAVATHWNRRAPDFDSGPTHGLLSPAQEAAWRGLLSQVAPPAPALEALDLGCGTGFLALLLAEGGHRVAGIDLAADMLALARSKAAARGLDIPFLEADAEAPPFPQGSFDLLTTRHLIWTLPNPAGALRAWHALLRPGGRLALVEGAGWGMTPRDEYVRIREALPLFGGRPAAELAETLQQAGFRQPAVVPLTEAVFWGSAPTHERYLMIAERG